MTKFDDIFQSKPGDLDHLKQGYLPTWVKRARRIREDAVTVTDNHRIVIEFPGGVDALDAIEALALFNQLKAKLPSVPRRLFPSLPGDPV